MFREELECTRRLDDLQDGKSEICFRANLYSGKFVLLTAASGTERTIIQYLRSQKSF
jgi:hypothetical protein